MGSKSKQSWEEFLNPQVMRPRLIAASIYITGFEVLKGVIVDRIRGFFLRTFGPFRGAHGLVGGLFQPAL